MDERSRDDIKAAARTDAGADDDTRYESLRYRAGRVPPRSYREYRDRRGAGGGSMWGSGRTADEMDPLVDARVFRDDVHGGVAGVLSDDTGVYRGRMRRYRGVPDRFRAEPGPHTGAGPRGYRRSDERIRDDVCDFLTVDGLLDARGIDVRVEDGEVTLDGTVRSRSAKRRAEDLAEIVYGVVDVHNRLRIGPQPP